ncbi:MAG: RNA helicase, partial [Propioniciclava sp.]
TMVRRTWRDISLMERDQRLPAGRDPDIGFAEATYAWATGVRLGDILVRYELTAGDFVCSMRMVIDALGQVADAAGTGVVRTRARAAIDLLRKGFVAAWDEDD